VTFPESNANHNPDQVFYYDENYVQRRMDYSPYVTVSPPVTHYTRDPKMFDGFVFPTRGRVHHHDADGVADQRFAAITIDIDDVAVAWSAVGRRSGGSFLHVAWRSRLTHAGPTVTPIPTATRLTVACHDPASCTMESVTPAL
jgi:hypothetical protein